MFVGHGLLAFAVAAGLAHRAGADRERALAVGILAGGFATVPDVDVVHPLLALLAEPVALGEAPGRFWALSTEIHRTATHSLVVGAVAAAGVTALAATRTSGARRLSETASRALAGAGTALLGCLVGVVWLLDGPPAGAVVGLVALAGVALAVAATRYGLGARTVGLAASIGLLSHPFGDLLTGQPPPLFYPIGPDVLAARVALHPDPTLHLLGAFLVELATVWLALSVLAGLSGVRLRRQVGLRSLAGVGYAGAVLVLPAPVLDAATPFVFSVLAVGLVGAPLRPTREGVWWRAVTTGLAAVTVAALAYGAAYVAL